MLAFLIARLQVLGTNYRSAEAVPPPVGKARGTSRAALVALWLAVVLCSTAARAQELSLTLEQRQWIAQHRLIRIAPDPDLAPIDSLDADGRERGLAADYLKLIGTRTGFEFRTKRVPNRGEAIKLLRAHEVDLLPSAFAATQVDYAAASAPYLRLSAALYVRHGDAGFAKIDALDRRKVAVVANSPWPELLANKDSKAEIVTFNDLAAALRGLQASQADVFAGDPITTAAAINRLGLASAIDLSGQIDLEAPLAFAARSDWTQLRDIIDIALKSVSFEEEKNLRTRWITTAAQPQANPASANTGLPASNAAAVAASLKTLPTQRDLSDDTRKQIDDLLNQAQADNARADQLLQQLQDLRHSADSAEADAQKLEDALSLDDTGALLAWRAALPERATVQQLETQLTRERDVLAEARNSAATLDAQIRQQSARSAQLRDELAAAHATLDAVSVVNADQSRPEPASADKSAAAPLSGAQHLRAQAAQRLATIQVASLDLENRSYEPRLRLLSAQLHDRQRTAEELSQHVGALETLVLNRVGADVADLRDRVMRERGDVGAHSRLLGETADANIALSDQLAHAIARLTELHTQKQVLDTARQETDQALDNTEERIRIGSVSEAVGLILLAEQRKLKSVPLLKRQLAALQTELAKTRLDLIDLRERQTGLSDTGGAVEKILSRLSDIPAAPLAELRAGLFRLLATRAEIVPRLIAQQTRLASTLAEAEQELRDLTATTAKLSAMLATRLLWTPSHAPVNLTWAAQLPRDTADFFLTRRWMRALSDAAATAIARPVRSIGLVVSLTALLWLRRRARQRFEQIAAPMRRIRTDRYGLTGEALAWTLVCAAPAPFMLYALGRLLEQVAINGSGFTDALGNALGLLALPAGALAYLRVLTAEGGLAHYHLRWSRPRREALYTATPVLALLILPATLFIILLSQPDSAEPLDTLGRLLFALALAGIGLIGWRLLGPGRVWTLRNVVLREPLRSRQIVRIAFSAICAVLVALDLIGYFVTAETLSVLLLQTLGVMLCIATLHGLATRWLVLAERRLALKRMLEKMQDADAENARSEGEAVPELPEVEEITVANVSAQTRRLLRAMTILGLVSGLLWVWSDVTPALSLLGNISVWDSSQLIDGKQTAIRVSLRDILESFVLLVLTWVATRNLPGLLEVGILRRLHVDAATRYALTSITRYLIVFAGTIFGLSMLGLRWSNLQWLAAGFSVGLGFGMQEIFANFISGLIVLFERPIRIGDTISIGTVEGTVARIRTRATTIVDGDNREVVVPNKNFITERLVNWTLSDTTTRLVVKVGVAHRNDPAQAQELLLAIAAAHPQVLKEPAPSCWLTGLGASTQDFELWVYVGEIGERNPVRTDLQMRIVETFRENAIELAFPQMDLWVRNKVQVQSPAADAPPSKRKS